MKPESVNIPEGPHFKTKTFWQQHIALHKASGKTRAAYCRLNQLNYDSFGYWVKKGLLQSPPLIAVKVKSEVVALKQMTLCTLQLANGCFLQIHDQQALSYVLERFS